MKTDGKITPRLIGINEASTFWGFCQWHDASTFSPLETQQIEPTLEQAFLMAYRPLVKELYLKERRLAALEIDRSSDKGKPVEMQLAVQEFVHYTGLGVDSAVRDLRHHKSSFDRDLLAGDYSSSRFVAIHLAQTSDLVCSGVVQPDFTFAGEPIQDLARVDELLHSIAFSLLAADEGSMAVFSWRSDADHVCSPLVDSLLALPSAQIPNALVRFVLSNFENTFFRPEWWEALPCEVSGALGDRLMHGVSPRYPVGADYLTDDGICAVDWTVLRVDERR